jgi:NADPH-dependent curcumin reductase CurA
VCSLDSAHANLTINLQLRFYSLIYTRATIQGVLARDTAPRHGEMVAQMSEWIIEGKIQYRETFADGFATLPSALNGLFSGKNTGKMVVRVEEK